MLGVAKKNCPKIAKKWELKVMAMSKISVKLNQYHLFAEKIPHYVPYIRFAFASSINHSKTAIS